MGEGGRASEFQSRLDRYEILRTESLGGLFLRVSVQRGHVLKQCSQVFPEDALAVACLISPISVGWISWRRNFPEIRFAPVPGVGSTTRYMRRRPAAGCAGYM